jgi:Bacterial Ig domain/Right handed beta helix region
MMVTKSFTPARNAAAAAALLLTLWSGTPGASPLPAARDTVVNVATEADLQAAVASITSDTTIVIAPGSYALTRTLSVKGAFTNVVIRGATNNPNDVVLFGAGMSNPDYAKVPHGISVAGGQGFTVAYLTIRDVYADAIVLGAGTVAPRISHVHLINAGHRFINAKPDSKGGGVNDGVIEYSELDYTTTARDSNAGAIEVSTGAGWTVRNNTLRNVKAPGDQIAGPAVLMSLGSSNSLVEGNVFINCQREIALGLEERTPNDHEAGIVRNNFIYRSASLKGESAIHVADSPNTQVLHNTILISGTYASPIEYRFRDSTGITIQGNLTDGPIVARDGATGASVDNYTNAVAPMFVSAAAGDLHLVAGATAVIDRIPAPADAQSDIDGDLRPQGGAADFGADELVSATGSLVPNQLAPLASPDLQPGGTSTTTSSTSSASGTSAVTTGTGLPYPWMTSDVGNPPRPGSAAWASEVFTVQGGGSDIGGSADQFRFVYQTLDGDGEIVARVTSLDNTQPWAKAGVMIRDELTGSAKHASVLLTPSKGVVFIRRIANGATTMQTAGVNGRPPYWLKVTRTGQLFTAFASANGSSWTSIGSETINLNRLVYVGLAVTSRAGKTLTTAKFANVTVKSSTSSPTNQPPSVSITTPVSGTTCVAPCNLAVGASASDADGTVAKVDFYAGSSLIGSASTSPFIVAWSNVPAGSYTLKAVAQDTSGAATTSATVNVNVTAGNQPPVVSLTAPANGATFAAGTGITLSATASDPDGTIGGVDFYADSTLVGTDATTPYSVVWNSAPAGLHTLKAVARDNSGATTTSTAVSVTVNVNKPPTVSLTAPTAGASFLAPANITLSATAADSDGTISGVDFYAGSTLIGSKSSSPYTVTWSNVQAGSYTVTAVARDNGGASTTSAAISVTARLNKPPTVSLTAPVAGAVFGAPATITLAANATDADGTVARVDFYAGSTLIGWTTASPYAGTLAGAPAGSYVITAVARDNDGATTTSAPVTVSVAQISLRYVEFNASTDNSIVTGYTVEFFLAGTNPATSSPVRTLNIGKPAPVNGSIIVDAGTTIQALSAGTYFTTVTAAAPDGASRSAASATFVR